jgi:ABC-type transporter Mla maintaining outer membrane lipid asymmetry permease subunit MlaE
MTPQSSMVDRAGAGLLGAFEFVGSVSAFGARAVVEAARPPYEPREIIRHVYQFGYRSTPLIVAAGFAVGVVLSMHTRASLERRPGSPSRSSAKPAPSSPRSWLPAASAPGSAPRSAP